MKLACKRMGITRQTFFNWRKDDPDFAQAVTDLGEGVLDMAEAKLLQLINAGDRQAIIFYLKSKGKSRGYGDRCELTGPNGEPLQLGGTSGPVIRIEDLRQDLPPKSLAQLLALLTTIETSKANGTHFPNADDDRGAIPFAERANPTRFARAGLRSTG